MKERGSVKRGVMIFGPAGSGKTTLGRLIAEQLGVLFVDVDDFIWRKDTQIPFSAMYSRAEKIERLMAAIAETDRFVMAGSMDSFHEHFDPFFALAVHLTAPAEIRVDRVHRREYTQFGDRILKGGDMYEAHLRFLDDVAAYDAGGGPTSFAVHDAWARALLCPVLRLDGSEDMQRNADAVLERLDELNLW